MQLKRVFYILLCSLSLMGLASCLRGNNTDDIIPSTDAQIIAFSLSHDSVAVLATTRFSIDQVENKIYNYDSLPYLCQVRPRVIVNYTSGSGVSTLMTKTGNDTVWVKAGDSLDISNALNNGMLLKVFAPNGSTNKEYTFKINIHQVDPDSMQYEQIGVENFLLQGDNKTVKFKNQYFTYVKDEEISVYQSSDLKNWESAATNLPANTVIEGIEAMENGLCAYTETGELFISSNAISWTEISSQYENWDRYRLISVLGYLPTSATQDEGLAVVAEKNQSRIFAFLPSLFSKNATPYAIVEGDTVSSDFPLSGFSTINKKSLTINQIMLIGGSPSIPLVNVDALPVWITENGYYWVKLSDSPQGSLPSIEGGSAFVYNNELYFMGGTTILGTYNEEIYSSINGLVWNTKASKAQPPKEFTPRKNASIVVDNEGVYFYIVGGQNKSPLADIWKVVMNAQTFKK
ncbi:MAG: DUF6242 domain-containing protein [Candidatus Azobacteroides sp.]|nr:DUF6242 domain-containing protein [Candidatus Azobacteroides sp.]